MSYFINTWIRFFFLLTPFSALSLFLTWTARYTPDQRRRLCLHVMGSVSIICFLLYFLGSTIFSVLGITLDAFRIGAGTLLFISSVGLVQTKAAPSAPAEDEDIAVVPLAMPILVGPATIGTLLVMQAEASAPHQMVLGCMALLLAISTVGALFLAGVFLEQKLGKKGLNILSKISGLVLAALASQMIFTGIRNFLS